VGTVSDATITNDKLATAPTLISKGAGSDSGAIQLNCEQNTHGVKIKGPPHSAAQSYTLTLPSTAPSANKALITDGSGNLSFGSAGGLVKLNTTDVTSAQATVTFDNTVITDTYGKYFIEYEGAKPVTDSVYIRSRYSTDNGSSFLTGTFQYGYHHAQLGSGSHGGSGTTKSNYAENSFAAGNDANHVLTGNYRISHMRDANTHLSIEHNYIIKQANNNMYAVKEGYILEDTSVINYIEFSFSSGNIADGTFTLFGVVK